MAESLKAIMEFFGMSAHDFMVEWKRLTTEDKTHIKAGINNGTLTY